MSKTWYNDEYAEQVHNQMADAMVTIIAQICPGYELSHMGVKRDYDSQEVILKLHLNPKGKVKPSSEMKSELGYSSAEPPAPPQTEAGLL